MNDKNRGAGERSPGSTDPRRHAPATARNREPILGVLREILPTEGSILEIASGSGEHAAFLAPHFPGVGWQPTDADPDLFPSIMDWARTASEITDNSTATIHPPLHLNTCNEPWPVEHADAIIAINMIHISPWASCEGLMKGAGRILSAGGVLYLYGPFQQDGRHTAPSNEAFDASLRQRNPHWGIRNLDEVSALANDHGLRHDRTVPMPANNLSVVFTRS
ncbi:MAG: DUF938 domain-containing protein [Rhodospirillales bacterium]|nr:DUF938 domain-containing protein [Rhodospirillales bacterium]